MLFQILQNMNSSSSKLTLYSKWKYRQNKHINPFFQTAQSYYCLPLQSTDHISFKSIQQTDYNKDDVQQDQNPKPEVTTTYLPKNHESEMSQCSWIILQGLQNARMQLQKEKELQNMILEFQENLRIQKQSLEELQQLMHVKLIDEEKKDVLRSIDSVKKQIKVLLSCPSSCKNKLRKVRSIEVKTDKKVNYISKSLKKRFQLKGIKRNSKHIRKRSNQPHYTLSKDHIKYLKEINEEIGKQFFSKIQNLEKQNLLIKQQLSLLNKKLKSTAHNSPKQQILSNRSQFKSPRHLSQGTRIITLSNDNTKKLKSRIFMFKRPHNSQFECSSNTKRNISRNSDHKSYKIKYKENSIKDKKKIYDKYTYQSHIRNQYFEDEMMITKK